MSILKYSSHHDALSNLSYSEPQSFFCCVQGRRRKLQTEVHEPRNVQATRRAYSQQ